MAFASGMAAITALFLHCLKAGDHVVMSDVTYAAASELANQTLPRPRHRGHPGGHVRRRERAHRPPPQHQLVYLESPANPAAPPHRCRRRSPMCPRRRARGRRRLHVRHPRRLRPAELGADFVIQSLTKYICGHGDAIGGAVPAAADELSSCGPWPSTWAASSAPSTPGSSCAGAATLPIRMAAHQEGALAVARHLEEHPKITRVIYPGLPSHPQYELADAPDEELLGHAHLPGGGRPGGGAAALRPAADRPLRGLAGTPPLAGLLSGAPPTCCAPRSI